MAHFDEPVYIYDFRSIPNCNKTEGIKPGESATVLVRPEKDLSAPPVQAQGRRSDDGQLFEIAVTTDGGTQDHTWTWETLMDAIKVHRGTPGTR